MTRLKRKYLQCGIVVIALYAFPGCKGPYGFDTPTLIEPQPIPLEYAGYAATGRINVSAVFDYSGTAMVVPITKDILYGSKVESVATTPLRQIVKRQFDAAFANMFFAPKSSEIPDVKVKIVLSRMICKDKGGAVKCSIEFLVRVLDRSDYPIFEHQYEGVDESVFDGRCVPSAVYQSVRQVVESTRANLYESRLLIEEKVKGSSPKPGSGGHTLIREPSFLSFNMKPSPDGNVFTGSCRLACNDWDSSRAADWLRGRLEVRACDQLGVSIERVRVIYEKSDFDDGKSEWNVHFKAFARVPWTLDYNSHTRLGVCAVDLELTNMAAPQAAEKMKEYVMQEMNRRGIIVVDGKNPGGAGVRFDSFKTDERYNIISCAFRLVK